MQVPGNRVCRVVDGALSRQACLDVIAAAEARGFLPADAVYPPTYRNNDRQLLDDPHLAHALAHTLHPCLPKTLDGGVLVGLNTRFRICRYRAGQSFTVHQDGAWHPDDHTQSRLTLMLYLNDDDDFIGGQTRFYQNRCPDSTVWKTVRPRAGRLMLFDHLLWHDGQPVESGVKYILRTDVLYRFAKKNIGHRGYVWTVQRLRDGRLATGGRDRTVRIWSPDATVCQTTLTGHDLSALALAQAPDGQLWSGSRDQTLAVWDVDQATLQDRWTAHDGAVLSLASSNHGVVSAGADGAIHVWSAPRVCAHTLRGHDGWIRALAVTTDNHLISGGDDGTVRRWSLKSGKMKELLAVGDSAIWSLATDGDATYAGNAAGWITRCDQGQTWRAHQGGVRALLVGPDGVLLSGGEDDRVRAWKNGRRLWQVSAANFISGLALGIDGTIIGCGYAGIRKWVSTSSSCSTTKIRVASSHQHRRTVLAGQGR